MAHKFNEYDYTIFSKLIGQIVHSIQKIIIYSQKKN